MTDSETRVHKINVESGAVFPNTNSIRFDGDNNTLLGLLDLKAPLDSEQKVPIEHLPDAFVQESGFSGAKLGASSHTMVAEKDYEQYVSLDHKFYDYGDYVYADDYGYKFCVINEGIYGIGLYLKLMHGYNSTVFKVRAHIEKSDGKVYEISLIDKTGDFGGKTEFLYTGITEVFMEEADCVFFTVEQDRAGARIWGGYDTYATIHKIVRLPEPNPNVSSGSGGGSLADCQDVHDCLWCPDGLTDAESNFQVIAPAGYSETEVYNDLRIRVDNINCKVTLDGMMELPTPIWPAECSAEDIAACMCTANLTPEDLCLTFSNDQIIAIAGGYATIAELQEVKDSIQAFKDTLCTLVEPCINTYLNTHLCTMVTEQCGELVTESELGCKLLIVQPEHGTISAIPDKVTYELGESVELTVTPDNCYELNEWSYAASGLTSSTVQIVMDDSSVTVGADVVKKMYSLDVSGVNGSGILYSDHTCDEDGKYECGQVVRVELSVDAGWSLQEWTGDAAGASAGQNYVDVVMTGNLTVGVNLVEDGVSKIVCPFTEGGGVSTGDTGYKGIVEVKISGWGSSYPGTLSDAFYKVSWSQAEASNYNNYRSNDFRYHSNFDWKLQTKIGSVEWIPGTAIEAKTQYPLGDGIDDNQGGNYPAINWTPYNEPTNGNDATSMNNYMMAGSPSEGDREYTFRIDTGSAQFTRLWFRIYGVGEPSVQEGMYDSWADNTGKFWISVTPVSGGSYGVAED